jgi:hypothetical protein
MRHNKNRSYTLLLYYLVCTKNTFSEYNIYFGPDYAFLDNDKDCGVTKMKRSVLYIYNQWSMETWIQ